jgi:flagellar basal-body rod protein FlgG
LVDIKKGEREMLRALNSSITGMQACEKQTEIISNNIANVTTTAFKGSYGVFSDLLYQDEQKLGTNAGGDTIVPTGIQIGLGVKTAAVQRIHTQGEPRQTENPFDIFINGKGYLSIELPNGEIAYTRAGHLTKNGDGDIVTKEGYLVQPGINVGDAKDISISSSGVVSIKNGISEDWIAQGELTLTNFINETGLKSIGDNLYSETEASGAALTGAAGTENYGTFLQGWVEGSNVNHVTQITELIKAQRGYEMGSKVINAVDEMWQTANRIKG